MTSKAHPAFINGDRIELHPLKVEHAEIYVDWYNDLEIRRLSRMIKPTTIGRMQKAIENVNSSDSRIKFEIWHKVDQKPIGDIGLSDIEYHDRNAEYGVIIGEKEYWGQGYATEAIKLILKFAFEEVNLHKIFAGISAWNIGSEKSAVKAGMHLEATRKEDWYIDGEYVDTNIFAIFKRDWKKQS
ncbi:GNAT family N-acetyltransferase [Candidatus Lokiarchaeum ossiferum]|uniref:GNAT family N-acetyltransferase n=1 Tax=Candidatus Lokiarchaeum ossiferum TaxID=2951803 RepID=UPI00352E0E42